ncbi:hypothetical protein DFJ73DRAFT_854616 [Zopfochytrium polystomum]|nr:hypothetical protein DFJ73DRAFT_854616 [Zopfochytrium polystomum]
MTRPPTTTKSLRRLTRRRRLTTTTLSKANCLTTRRPLTRRNWRMKSSRGKRPSMRRSSRKRRLLMRRRFTTTNKSLDGGFYEFLVLFRFLLCCVCHSIVYKGKLWGFLPARSKWMGKRCGQVELHRSTANSSCGQRAWNKHLQNTNHKTQAK